MKREYLTVKSIAGPLFYVEKTHDVSYSEIAQVRMPSGEERLGQVLEIDEVFTDPQMIHRNMLVEKDYPGVGKVHQVGHAIKLSDTPASVRGLPPLIGEHTDEILSGLGYDEQTIKRLREDTIVG